jgi:hypothetical protein
MGSGALFRTERSIPAISQDGNAKLVRPMTPRSCLRRLQAAPPAAHALNAPVLSPRHPLSVNLCRTNS